MAQAVQLPQNKHRRIIHGTAAAPGAHIGTARIIAAHRDVDAIQPGDVLLCPAGTRAASLPLSEVGALVFDAGGVLSNPVIVARECGIPAVVAANASSIIRDGQRVLVDGDRGTVRILT
jgi:phosphohistidine swiveling domain-containing protein